MAAGDIAGKSGQDRTGHVRVRQQSSSSRQNRRPCCLHRDHAKKAVTQTQRRHIKHSVPACPAHLFQPQRSVEPSCDSWKNRILRGLRCSASGRLGGNASVIWELVKVGAAHGAARGNELCRLCGGLRETTPARWTMQRSQGSLCCVGKHMQTLTWVGLPSHAPACMGASRGSPAGTASQRDPRLFR